MRISWPREISFRTYIFVLILLILAPLILFGSGLMIYIARSEQESIKQGLQDTTRALSLAVDRDLLNSVNTLKAMAASEFLDSWQLKQFYDFSQRVKADQPSWKNVILNDRHGRSMMNLLVPFGQPLSAPMEFASMEEVLRTGKPAFLNFVVGPLVGPSAAVRVPVIRDGQVRYVMTAVLDLTLFNEILIAQQLPASWIGTVYDQERRVLARTHQFEKFLGQQSGPLIKLISPNAPEGWVRGESRDGTLSYAAFHKSAITGWSVAITVPAAEVYQSFYRSIALIFGLGILCLAIALALGVFISRRINSLVLLVTNLAKSLGQGQAISKSGQSRIGEINQVTSALEDASSLLQTHAAERDQSERDMRRLNLELEERVDKRTAELRMNYEVLSWQAELLDLTHDAVLVRDFNDGKILFWNDGAMKVYGWSKQEALGKDIHDLLQATLPEPLEQIEEKLSQVGHWDGEIIHLTKDHREIIVLSRWSLRRGIDGAPLNILQVNSDITEKKKAERSAEESKRLATLGTTAAMFAHEIANPLNSIGMALQVARVELEKSPNDSLTSILEILTEEIKRLTSLLEDFRLFVRPRILRRQANDLIQIVENVLATERVAYEAAGIAVKRHFDSSLPLVPVDAEKMKQVFLNLFKNAVEAMPAGGTLSVSGSLMDGRVVIGIKDTGCGIPEGLDVFELFQTTKETGTGLGLSIVRQIVAAHEGIVEFTSKPGEGTNFKISLPILADSFSGK